MNPSNPISTGHKIDIGLTSRLEESAITIQSHYRANLAKRELKAIKKAALIMQSQRRSLKVRSDFLQMKSSVLKVQSIFRMKCVEKEIKRHYLAPEIARQALEIIEDPEKLNTCPHPSSGKSRHNIFMPQYIPVVIRKCQNSADKKRFEWMYQARSICINKKLKHIVVPKARILKGEYIVEERLPNEHASEIGGMAFYYENRESFDETVSDYFSFLLHGHLGDTYGTTKHILNYLGYEVPRFDNVLPFSVEESGEKIFKLGLVDLEAFSYGQGSIKSAIIGSLMLFPYQAPLICNALNKSAFDTYDQKKLNKALSLYKFCIEDVLAHFSKHGITPENPVALCMTNERENQIKEQLGGLISRLDIEGLKWEEGELIPEGRVLIGDKKRALERVKNELIPFIIKTIKIFGRSKLNYKNYGELIKTRIVKECEIKKILLSRCLRHHNPKYLYADQKQQIKAFPFGEFIGSDCEYEEESISIAELVFDQLIEALLTELVKGGEILVYKPGAAGSYDLMIL